MADATVRPQSAGMGMGPAPSPLAALVLDCEDMLYGLAQVERPREDTLLAAVTADSDTTWRLGHYSMWKKDDYAEYVPSDGSWGEIVILAEDHPSPGADVSVRRAQQRTSAASSYTAGSVFRKNPTFPRVKIARFLREVVDTQLWPHVWIRTGRSLTWSATARHYALNALDFDVEEVYQYNLSSTVNFNPFPRGWWEVVTDVHSGMQSTGRALRLHRIYDSTKTVYYTARTKPSSADLSTLPSPMLEMLPWGACWMLLGGTRAAPRRIDRKRVVTEGEEESQVFADASFFKQSFLTMRDDYRRQLLTEKKPPRNYRPLVGRRG